MPHFVVEYSSNLEDEIDTAELFRKLHDTAIETGVFPIGGIRSRAVRCDQFRIADGDPELGFVHLTIKLGAGREIAVRRVAGERLFETLKAHLKPIFDSRYMGISFELVELHPELNFKINNIHEKFKNHN